MCNPALAVAALAAASTAYQVDSSNKQTAWQNKQTEMNAEANNKAVAENFKNQNQLLNMQELQESEQAAQQKMQQRLAVQKEVASQRVASGEAGVSGLSIDSIFADVIRQGANNLTTIDLNLADSNAQRDVERKQLHNAAIAGMQSTSTYKGSNRGLGAGLQIVGSGLNAYTSAGGKFGSTKDSEANKQGQKP